MADSYTWAPNPPESKSHGCSSPPWLDDHAERTLAACAAFSQTAARAALARVAPGDVYDLRCWQVIVAAADIADHTPEPTVDPWWREDAVADAAGIHRHDLRAWCTTAPVAADTNGAVAARVRHAAIRRHRIAELVAELEDLGVTTNWSAAR